MMESSRFDLLTRVLAGHTRRGLLAGLAGSIGLAALPSRPVAARKKLVRNQYGCVELGGKCRGNDNNCCSGVCQGKKPKPGKKDKSQCVAHHVGICQPGQDTCTGGLISCGTNAICLQTTGKASFCGSVVNNDCRACKKDTDCEKEFGAGAACVICAGSCPATQERQCIGPA